MTRVDELVGSGGTKWRKFVKLYDRVGELGGDLVVAGLAHALVRTDHLLGQRHRLVATAVAEDVTTVSGMLTFTFCDQF